MSGKKTYNEYFDIDPKYYAAVTADLIKKGMVSWKSFYPHETFVKLLEKTHIVLSGKEPRSLWVEGAYGTGKSHAALTVKSLLEASDADVRAYFEEFGLSSDLCQKIITDKNSGKLVTIHRIGSGSIRSDQDLIIAVQESIMSALEEHGLENHGEASLKEVVMAWLEKDANKVWFNSLIQDEKYAWNFGGEGVEAVLEKLRKGIEVQKTMRDILTVAEDNGIRAFWLDIQGMAEWIRDIISKNHINAILFVWDEFTEFFQNNQNSLTGFQTLAEISLSSPFYFMVVSHESRSLFADSSTAKKILDRFVPPVKIELPENMAFRLMAQAMKKTSDSVLLNEWVKYAEDINLALRGVREIIEKSAKKESEMGEKTTISDKELQAIVPIHPYAALLLKHLSVAFNSNQRSMFDFIISNDVTDAKGFKWFIGSYGPLDVQNNLLTIDMLWDFFNGKGQNGLNDDVRVILDSYNLLRKDQLTPDEERVFKTVLLLQAISQRVTGVELLRPNEMNVDLAFSGTDWSKGKGRNIAEKLCRDGLIFKRPVGGGKMEYTVANSTGDAATIEKKKKEVKDETKLQDLIVNADVLEAIQMPASVRNRLEMERVTLDNNIPQVISKARSEVKPNRYKVVVTFAQDDAEEVRIKDILLREAANITEGLIFISCLTPLGEDLYDQYIENMAYSRYYVQNDKVRANNYEQQAKKCLNDWKNKIVSGAFRLYTVDDKNGQRLQGISALKEELKEIEQKKYYWGLSVFDVKNETLYAKTYLSQGAECGIKQTLTGTFRSVSNILSDVWGIDRYWKDPAKKSLPIVCIKNKVEELIQEGFDDMAGRVSVLSIFEALEEKPFGFMPSGLAAFILGFVLKEYASSDFFWSNGANSEAMSVEKMKQMIANTLNQKVSPSRNYREEYIVVMSGEQKAFLHCTAKVFHIEPSLCSSIENARDQLRSKMRNLDFPIWCIKSLLDGESLICDKKQLAEVIDCYCGIANTANVAKGSESELAEEIGKLLMADSRIADDLEVLFTNVKCSEGMRAYIRNYKNGELTKLAVAINDNGAYLKQVRQKFNADAANWVWNAETADEKINDVILEYHIIAKSNEYNPKTSSLHDCVIEWNRKSNHIKISYEALKATVGALEEFLGLLLSIQKVGNLQEQHKQRFYDLLLEQGNSFAHFYERQTEFFKQVASSFIEELDDNGIEKIYTDLPEGQFVKSSTEYFKYIESQIKEFLKKQAKRKLVDLWKKKTGTKSPEDWSRKYQTPIFCMFEDDQRSSMKQMLGVFEKVSVPEEIISKTITFLEKADFYEKLDDAQERDRCFSERVIAEYAVMLTDVEEVREELSNCVQDSPLDWMDNTTVHNKLKSMCDKAYKMRGKELAMQAISDMDAQMAKKYLCDLIEENPIVGMEIIRSSRR